MITSKESNNLRIRRAHVTIQATTDAGMRFLDADFMREHIERHYKAKKELVYACWAYEEAPRTGQRHIHVYLEFKHPHYMHSISKNFANGHVEKREGVKSPVEMRKYVAKRVNGDESLLYEVGDFISLETVVAKHKKQTTDEKLIELVRKYDSYEECVKASPGLATHNKEAIQVLLEGKKQSEKNESAVTLVADNGDELFF